MANYGSTPSFIPRSLASAAASARRRRGGAALAAVFVVLCCLSYASVQSQLSAGPLALEAQQLLAPVAPLKISFDAKIGGADPRTHLNTFALSHVKLAGNAQWKDFANREPPHTYPHPCTLSIRRCTLQPSRDGVIFCFTTVSALIQPPGATPMQARPFNNRGGFVADKFPDKERRWLNHVLTHMSTKGGHMKPKFKSAIARAFKAGRDSGVENDPLAQAEAALQVLSPLAPPRRSSHAFSRRSALATCRTRKAPTTTGARPRTRFAGFPITRRLFDRLHPPQKQ